MKETYTGWHDIASRHNCSVQAARRLAKYSGLPVKKPKKGKPFMIKDEYLIWAQETKPIIFDTK